MKYIRTENGIFRRYKNSTIIDNIFYYPNNGGFPSYKREPILKQANNIEELCDEFVAITYDNNHILYDDEVSDWKTREEYSKLKFEVAKGFVGKDTIYGAIWTDKGLIYVAKMNDKGEWELL